MILDEFFKPKPAAVLAEDNPQGTSPDDEVKFFIDSEPAYYAVMDRFGDHIDFRGDDMVAPLRLWGAIQQTAGDAGGAADIAGLEDEPMWVGDELDEQGLAENYPKHQDLSGISTDKLKEYIRYATRASDGLKSYLATQGEGNQVRRVRAELERRMKGLAEGEEHSSVASAITRRIMLQRHDLLSKYGPVLVTQAIDEVADFVGDVEEIGSSDVSGWIKQVEQMLANNPAEAFGEGVAEATLSELSPATLASYKTKAGAAATAADLTGDRRTADRRFSGIVKATKKQFDQDATQSAQKMHESRLTLMADIIKTQ